jgi:hypothetical protein
VGLLGWWVGRGEGDPSGHLLRVQPDFSRYVATAVSPRDITELLPVGTPALPLLPLPVRGVCDGEGAWKGVWGADGREAWREQVVGWLVDGQCVCVCGVCVCMVEWELWGRCLCVGGRCKGWAAEERGVHHARRASAAERADALCVAGLV